MTPGHDTSLAHHVCLPRVSALLSQLVATAVATAPVEDPPSLRSFCCRTAPSRLVFFRAVSAQAAVRASVTPLKALSLPKNTKATVIRQYVPETVCQCQLD